MGYDILSIKEDMSDREQSMLVDFFRDDTQYGEKLYDVVYSIVHGTYKAPKNDKSETTEEEKEEIVYNIPKDTITNALTIEPIESKEETFEYEHDDDTKSDWEYNKEDISKKGSGTEILNPGLIIIPDKVITNVKYLENIKGITHVISHNNAKINPPRITWQYVQFWLDYIDEEDPKFEVIDEDIKNNEGPTYDYLMEHPPNDRILTVLEKVVDQLRHPMLTQMDATKHGKTRYTQYRNDILRIFKTQCPDYYKQQALDKKDNNFIKTCILFKSNTDDTNFDVFELMITIQDIVDRIFYDFDRFGIDSSHQILGNRENMDDKKYKEWSDILQKRNHFASKLNKNEYDALNHTLSDIKNASKHSFFPKLLQQNEKIEDNVVDFQKISLSFVLFIKAFMSETGNCLEKGNHIWEKSKLQHLKKRGKERIIDSLKMLKTETWKELKKEIKNLKIDDLDCEFHNDNMPLQFDLCIIPKKASSKEKQQQYKQYGLEKNPHTEFDIESDSFQMPTDRKSIYVLYGQMITLFNKILSKERPEQEKKGKKSKKAVVPPRNDDRYIVVIDQIVNKMYMFPPRIENGPDGNLISHKKRIFRDKDKKKKDEKENKESDKKEDEQPKNDKVRNKFSLISYEHNDLTNFYLTSQCVIPSIVKNEYFGAKDLEFVLSAHFHKQRQWHRHPKLRLYQYVNGGALRFLHYNGHTQKGYKYEQDLIDLWPKYFKNASNGINDKFIAQCDIFDGVMDLYKCDAEFFRWDNAVKRCIFDKFLFIETLQKQKYSKSDYMTLRKQIQSKIGQEKMKEMLKVIKVDSNLKILFDALLTDKDQQIEDALRNLTDKYGEKWKSVKTDIINQLNAK